MRLNVMGNYPVVIYPKQGLFYKLELLHFLEWEKYFWSWEFLPLYNVCNKDVETGVSPPFSLLGPYNPRWITYGLSWKIFLQATAGICDVMEDVIKAETPNEGDVYMLDDVIKVSA